MSWYNQKPRRTSYEDLVSSRNRIYVRVDEKRIATFSATSRFLVVRFLTWNDIRNGDLHSGQYFPLTAYDGEAWDVYTLIDILEELK